MDKQNNRHEEGKNFKQKPNQNRWLLETEILKRKKYSLKIKTTEAM